MTGYVWRRPVVPVPTLKVCGTRLPQRSGSHGSQPWGAVGTTRNHSRDWFPHWFPARPREPLREPLTFRSQTIGFTQ